MDSHAQNSSIQSLTKRLEELHKKLTEKQHEISDDELRQFYDIGNDHLSYAKTHLDYWIDKTYYRLYDQTYKLICSTEARKAYYVSHVFLWDNIPKPSNMDEPSGYFCERKLTCLLCGLSAFCDEYGQTPCDRWLDYRLGTCFVQDTRGTQLVSGYGSRLDGNQFQIVDKDVLLKMENKGKVCDWCMHELIVAKKIVSVV